RPHDVREPPDARRRHGPEHAGERRRVGAEPGRAQARRQDAGARTDRRPGARRRDLSRESAVTRVERRHRAPLAGHPRSAPAPWLLVARDVAFPRLNALSYWIFLVGGLFLNASFLAGTPPDVGWFGYANLTSKQFSPTQGVDFWLLSLLILGVSSMIAAINFIVTILNMHAPGMRLMRMPVFVWMTLVVQFLIVLAFPPITVGLIFLMFDRFFSTHFSDVAAGGDLHLWQHL